jgi:hypothetical protein
MDNLEAIGKGEHMNRKLKVGFLAVLAIALFGHYKLEGQQKDAVTDTSTATNRVVRGIYINSGLDTNNGSFVSPAEYFPVDSQLTVTCPSGASSTCSIQADMIVQNGNETFSSNTYSMCLIVDGKFAPNCGSTVGSTPSDGTYVQGSTSEIVTGLAEGMHTVQTKFFSADGAFMGYYNITYRVYKP